MPKIKPNPQLKQIVLEETNDGRDVVRYLKSTFMQIEDGVSLFGLRHKDYARSHKIAAARILARIGLEEGKRYLRRTYVRTPFRRVHPEDEDGPKREMAASTSELYRLVKKETNDGRDIIIRFVGIMKGYHPEYKPHLRMAAAKELIRQIEFDYEEEPGETATASVVSTPEPTTSSESNSDSQTTNPVYPTHPENPDSDKEPNTNQPNPVYPTHPTHPDSDEITAHHQNQTNHSSDTTPSLADIQGRMHIEDGSVHYRDYAAYHAKEGESIYQSIIRRASDERDMKDQRRAAYKLIAHFNWYMDECDPDYQPISVPDHLITKSLEQRKDTSKPDVFDPADYYDLDQDYFYYCMCLTCEACDELHYFFKFMRELEEEYEDP